MIIPARSNDDESTASPVEDPSHLLIPSPSLERRKGGGGGSKGGSSEGHESSSSGSSSSKGGESSSFAKSSAAKSFPISSSSSSTKNTASAYSEGGGKPETIPEGSLFSGREAGGGDRSTVYGTSRYGSGYPYGDEGAYVSGRPFPYYFYPVCIYPGYYGNDEYCHVDATEQPGGNLTEVIIQPSYNTSSVTYRIVGDNSSVTAVYAALVSNCSVANASSAISLFNPSPSTYPLPEQIIQYYRSSSFALSLDGYNNTASSFANMPASNSSAPLPLSDDTPLPSGLNITFLQCLNSTIGQRVPLMDPPNSSSSLSAEDIALITTGSIVGFVIISVCVFSCCVCYCERDRSHSKSSYRMRYSERKRRRAEELVRRERLGHIRLPSETGLGLGMGQGEDSSTKTPLPSPVFQARIHSPRRDKDALNSKQNEDVSLLWLSSPRSSRSPSPSSAMHGPGRFEPRLDIHILDVPPAHTDANVAK